MTLEEFKQHIPEEDFEDFKSSLEMLMKEGILDGFFYPRDFVSWTICYETWLRIVKPRLYKIVKVNK